MNEDFDISDVNGVCRLCLNDAGTIIPIFGRENTSRDCIPLSKKILACVSVKVLDGDGLPSMICVSCVHQVDSWHGFKNTCDTSQKKLSSWLQRTNPDVFSKNNAENEERCDTATTGRSVSPDIIALSSDDEDVVVTQPPKIVGGRRIIKGSLNRSQKLSVVHHEISPLPVDDDSQNEQSSHPEVPEDQANIADSMDGLPKNDETSDDILPDSDAQSVQEKLPTVSEDSQSKTDDAKDLEPKDVVCNGVEESSEMSQDGSSMDVDLPELAVQNENSQDDSSIHEKTAHPLAIENERHGSSLSDQDCSNWSQSDGVTETQIEGIAPLNKTVPDEASSEKEDAPTEVQSTGNKQDDVVTPNENHVENNDADENPEEVLPADKPEDPKVSNKPEEISIDNSSSIVIGEVTSLTSQAEAVGSKVQEQQQNSVAASGKDWDKQSQEDTNSRDVIPDIVICEAPMVASIKEEPMSAEEEEGSEDEAVDEEDPLNFHSVMIKREPDDWLPESGEQPDEKPDVALLNEAIDYSPKRLKCGKLHCEPCRVSFNNDVYYERHTKSIRHKLNYRRMRNGQGPTKKRGKSLTDTFLGKSVDVPRVEGRFYCNVCPKSFKHSRNLKTHQKTHLIKNIFEADRPEEYGSREPSDLETSSQVSQVSQGSTSSSKPPQRQSASKLDFRHFNESNDRKCDLCDQVFTNFAALVSHKRFCGRSINQKCRLCQQTFTTTSLFFKHRKTCYQLYRKQVPRTDVFYKMKKVQKPVNIPQPPPSPVPLDGSVLACTLCNLTFHSSPDLISHMQQNHMDFGKPNSPAPAQVPNFTKPNASYRSNTSWFHYCKFCPRSFETIGALTSHTGYHARKSIYCCKFCHKKNFKDKISFRQHMKLHIADPNLNRNVCWICYTPFSSPAVLAEHKSVHENLKVKIFSCDTCGNSYNTKELLYKHKKVAHLTLGIFNPDPMAHLAMGEDIMPHEPKVQLIDEDNKLFKCKICKKKFTTLGNLKRHSIKHRKPPLGGGGIFGLDRPHQHRCTWCLKAFKTMSGLLNHKPICNRVKTIANVNNAAGVGSTKPLKCKGCNKWFASQNSLYKHKVLKRCRGPTFVSEPEPMVSHLRTQNCPNCDQEFLSEESLNCHKKHCKPSLDKLTCDCGEVFASVELKLTHAESCPSNCTCKTCNLKFNSPEELDSHKQVCDPSLQVERLPPPPPLTPKPGMILQNRSPPVQCQKCKKPFVYMKKLQTHEEKCLNDRWPCSNCGQCFSTENSLYNHRANKSCLSSTLPMVQQMRVPDVSSDGFMFNCQYCMATFTSGGELNLHILMCSVRSQTPAQPSYKKTKKSDIPESALYSCNLCDKTFIWKANVARHQKVVHKIDMPVESSFDSPYRSESPFHVSVEQEAKTFQCEHCPGIIFHKQQGFLEHQKMHVKLNQDVQNWEGRSSDESVLLTCELCDKKLPEALYPVHMDEHMNDDLEESHAEQQQQSAVGNPGVEMFPCDVCGKEFFTAISRKSHRAMHYRNGDLLSNSPKKVTPKTHIFDRKSKRKVKYIRCMTCNKMLSINSMPKHKMMHVREAAEFYGENESMSPSKSAPIQNLPRCLTPNLVSDIPFSLEKSEEGMMTVFPCPKCEKTFKLRKSLMDHLKSQHDESFETESSTSSTQGPADQFPYKCLYCDLSWKHKSVYERHLSSKKHLEIQQQLSGII